jgi:predicted DNA-binding ribbon-helix-helix protein
MLKHSLSIQGHRTSITLEALFWDTLKLAAHNKKMSVAEIVAQIDTDRTTALSSAVRVWLLQQALAGTLTLDDLLAHKNIVTQNEGENE